jgi:hypothetical protein
MMSAHAIARLAAADRCDDSDDHGMGAAKRFRRPYARHFERDPSYDPRTFPDGRDLDPSYPIVNEHRPPPRYYTK